MDNERHEKRSAPVTHEEKSIPSEGTRAERRKGIFKQTSTLTGPAKVGCWNGQQEEHHPAAAIGSWGVYRARGLGTNTLRPSTLSSAEGARVLKAAQTVQKTDTFRRGVGRCAGACPRTTRRYRARLLLHIRRVNS